MAATADQVAIELIATVDKHDATVQASADAFDRNMSKMENAASRAEQSIAGSSEGIKTAVHELAAELAGAFAVEKLAEYADEYTRFTNALKVAGLAGDNLIRTQRELINVANQNGVSIESVSGLYRQLGIASAQTGATSAENIKVAAGFAAALRIQGTSTQTAQYATMEFGHALEETKVQARAFNALQFEMPIVLQTIAKNMEGTGGTVAGLRREILAGKVSNKDFFDAFVRGSDDLQAKSKEVNLTIGGSLEVLKNNLVAYVGSTGQASGATATVTGAIKFLGDNVNNVIPALEVIAAAFGIKYVAGLAGAEKGLLATAIAQAQHLAGVAAGTRAVNEAAEAELAQAKAAQLAATEEGAASRAIAASIGERVAALKAEAAQLEANIALAAEARAAAIAEAPAARANAAAGFGNVRVGAGAQSTPAPTRASEAANTIALNRQQLTGVTAELAAAETALAAAELRTTEAAAANTAATLAVTEARAASTVAATLAAGATEAFNVALSFVGGPIGAAVLALAAGLIYLATASGESAKAIQEAETRATGFRDRVQETTGKGVEFTAAVRNLTEAQNATAGAARNAAGAFRDQATAADLAARAVASLTAQERQKRLEEIQRDRSKIEGALNSTAGIDFRNGNVTFASNPQQQQNSAQAAFARSIGAPTFGRSSDAAVAAASRDPSRLNEDQQRKLAALNAATEKLTTARSTLTQLSVEEAAILKQPAYQAAGKRPLAGGRVEGPGEGDLIKAEEAERVAKAGPDKRAAIAAEETANYLKERARLIKDADPAAIPALDAQAKKFAADLAANQRKSLDQREGKRGSHAAETAANKEATADRETTTQIAAAREAEAKAAETSAAARTAQAVTALAAAAADTTTDAATREARIAQASAELRTAAAAENRLELELGRIDTARAAKDREVDDRRNLSEARKGEIKAANLASAEAQKRAARDTDAAQLAANQGAALGAVSQSTQGLLGTVAGNTAAPVAERAQAERALLELQHAEQYARQETLLDQRGVSDATRALARRVLLEAQAAAPQAAVAANLQSLGQARLQADEALARTSAERLQAEQALLDLTQKQRAAAAEVLLAQLDQSDTSNALRASTRGSLGALEASEQEQLRRRNRNPLQAQAEDSPRTREQFRDVASGDAAKDFQDLSAALVDVVTKAKTFGEALGSVVSEVENQILKAAADRLLAPVQAYAAKGLDKLFGTSATSSKISADATAASATLSLAAAATSAAAALAAIAAGGGVSGIGGLSSLFGGSSTTLGGFGGGSGGFDQVTGSIEEGGFTGLGFGGGLATGGRARKGVTYQVNEDGREYFTPHDSDYTVTPENRVGNASGGSSGAGARMGDVHLYNLTGTPAQAHTETMPNGDMKLTLAPLVNEALQGAGRDGTLAKAAKRSPQPLRRG